MGRRVVAVIGSRTFPDLTQVRSWVRANLKSNDIFVSGGASGVDQAAEQIARAFGFDPIVIRPDPNAVVLLGAARALKARNAEIVALADIVVAFWDGKSRGTKDAMDKAEALGKPVIVMRADGVPQF